MRVRAHIKEKRKLILGRIMQKTNLNKKALRRTARRAQERRIFKPAALAKAIASVFVCGALSGNVVGAPIVVSAQIEIGGVFFREALQKPLFPSRIEQNCSVRFFFTTSKNGVFLPLK